MAERFKLRSEIDDTELCGWCWPQATGDPRGNVILAHGAGEHARRYDEFAEALVRRDLSVWAVDHRGHGESIGDGEPGDFGEGGWDGLVADVNHLTSHASERHPGIPTILFGHSMGSLAAQQIMVARSRLLDGIVLSGTTCFDALAEAAEGGLESFNAPFEPARTPFDWLTRDPERVDAYIADPRCGFDPSPEAIAGMFAAAARLADPAELRPIRNDLPVLVVAGDADPLNAGWTLIDRLVERLQGAGLTNIEVRRHVGARHEPLNETDRDEVIRELSTWIETVIAAY